MKKIQYLILSALIIFMGGCARTAELSKVLWGSSTKALEDARVESVSRIYQCGYDDCFNEVLKVAKEEKLEVFIKDKPRSRIVLMHVPKSTNTTEVGVFFLGFGPQETKLEVASLSYSARDEAAKILFSKLGEAYPEKNK